MRPATLPVELSPPCCSGRGVVPERPARGRQRRCGVVLAAQPAPRTQQQQQGGGGGRGAAVGGSGAPAAPSTRTAAYAAGLGGFASSLATAATVTEAPAAEAAGQRQGTQQPPAGEVQRDSDGLLRNRPRPLKINLDLALYRARQKRLVANSSRMSANRSRLLRDVEDALRRCMEAFPEDGRPYVSLGKLMVEQRRYNEALALYEEGCTATGGTNAHIWSAWAYLAAKMGNISLARKLYDAAIVANPQHAAAWHGWGLLEKDQGNYLRARDLWLQGIQNLRRNPNPYLYQSLAVLAAEMDCLEEARKWFREGTRTLTGKASHALWQAWALMEQRQGDKAMVRPLYNRGLEVSPRSRYLHLAWALWEKEQGDVEEARRLFKQGNDRNPRDAAILQAWGLLEEEQGNIEEARRLFKRASKVDPSHLHVWQAWGCMEYRQQNYDTARELFQQGIWTAPPRAPDVCLVFQAWAMLERDAGNPELARELFKCAVKADPKSEPSWLAWAQMEEDEGFVQRAAELRSFNMQEHIEIVKPANFASGLGGEDKRTSLLAPIFGQIAKWFKRYEESGSDSDVELPELLPMDAVPKPEPESAILGSAAPAPARRGGRGRAADGSNGSGANGSSANGSS